VIEAEVFYDHLPTAPEAPPAPQEDRSSKTWTAVKNWFSPVTDYFSNKLPDKTPSEFATDIRDAAQDLGESVASHPVVEGVNNRVVQPARDWVQDTASSLSDRTFRDLYDSAVQSVKSADERVADWISPDEPDTLH